MLFAGSALIIRGISHGKVPFFHDMQSALITFHNRETAQGGDYA
jgi:hypothetical protein